MERKEISCEEQRQQQAGNSDAERVTAVSGPRLLELQLLAGMATFLVAASSAEPGGRARPAPGQSPLYFEVNQGQVDAEVAYLLRGKRVCDLYLTAK